MSKKLIICMLLLIFGITAEVSAQGILERMANRTKNKVQNKIEQKVDEKIDKAVDETFDDVEKSVSESVSGSKDDTDSTTESNPAQQDMQATPAAQDNKPKSAEDASVTQSKSDFVPGAVVLFEDNFANEQIGEFPGKWDLDDGSVEVAQIGDRKVAKFTQNGTIFPLMKKNQYDYLPEEFTIEWDIHIANKGEDMNHEIRLMNREADINTHNDQCAWIEIWYRPDDQAARVVWNCQKPTQGSTTGEQEMDGKLKSGWNHFAVSFNQRAFKLYVNGERLCNVPNMLAPKYMEYESIGSEGYLYSCISNVRIGQGAVALYDRNAGDIDKAMAETGKFVTNNILFDTGKATLKPESMAEIQKVADYMKKNPSVRFEVQGHTDNQGSDKINDPLSQQRAETIVAELVKLGVDEWNLRAVGKGSHEPVSDNKTEEGRAKNRRVEFVKR